jgi:complement component 1 Q subcomponent-binding protein
MVTLVLTLVNSEVVKLLNAEKKHELLQESQLDWLEEFKKNGVWQINDSEGTKEVTLTRKFRNEKISVIFSTDSLAENEEEYLEEEQEQEGMGESPIGVSILIEKEGKSGALEITASAQDSTFFIDNVSYLKDAQLAKDDTAQGDWARRGAYGGPVFADMDENLIEVFHQFIQERGFTEELAEFIPSYTVYKEQQEYVKWLENMANFCNEE